MTLLLPVLPLPLPEKVQRYLKMFNVANVRDRTHKRILSILKPGALELMCMQLRIEKIIENRLGGISHKDKPDHEFILLQVVNQIDF